MSYKLFKLSKINNSSRGNSNCWRQSQEYFTNRAKIKQKRADEEAR